ncbi:hypothetical protein EZH22_27410 [Xanthobacter dioxanivorans]|uniref:Uncharacterized protein n=1 Tax=Xanthobacter dioxanivorans TaxID=2528964 RepID=A0A974SIW2_9HYPH|nr:hypothetical protein [Xanthobacter dioxanivorans]QRG06609.1 hypothetical protein EZH22_27410 [Xanthobacter dioxanivorans]
MERDDIIGQDLLSFDVAVDGSRFRMIFSRVDGTATALSLPAGCLQALVMTLPKMMTEVLRARHKDETLRLVYPAHMVRVEQASDPSTLILTLATPDGFEVSFALGGSHLRTLAAAQARLGQGSGPAGACFN